MKLTNCIYTLALVLLLASGCKEATSLSVTPSADGLARVDTTQVLTRIAFGSCNRQNLPQPLWPLIQAQRPDLWIWGGDNIYGDTDDMEVLRQKYAEQQAHTGYRAFRAAVPVVGIWDDHDYGVNDGGREYPHKAASQQLMLDFLGVPADAPVRRREGAYNAYTFGPAGQRVKVVLLDARYFREPLEKNTAGGEQRYQVNATGSLLGEAQWQWLAGELADTSVSLYLITCGIQMIAADHGFEKWANFPQARARLMATLAAAQPQAVLLLSGDRHIAELSRMEVEGLPYPLYDVTASGLTHSYTKVNNEPNRYRVGNKLTGEKNYGLLTLDWSVSPVQVQVQVRGLEDVVHFEETIAF